MGLLVAQLDLVTCVVLVGAMVEAKDQLAGVAGEGKEVELLAIRPRAVEAEVREFHVGRGTLCAAMSGWVER
jgi:hypothetical protein